MGFKPSGQSFPISTALPATFRSSRQTSLFFSPDWDHIGLATGGGHERRRQDARHVVLERLQRGTDRGRLVTWQQRIAGTADALRSAKPSSLRISDAKTQRLTQILYDRDELFPVRPHSVLMAGMWVSLV